MSYNIYTGLLKINNVFEKGNESTLNYNYDFTHPSLKMLKEKYNLTFIAGYGDDLSKAFNLLHWLSNHIMHNGNSKVKAENILDFMECAFDKEREFALNCAMLSHVLAGCLMAVGIYAREVKLIPYSPYDFDSHRVVQAYITELKKWIMLDPTYSGYVMDKEGNYLNILEIRRLLAEQEYIIFNKQLNYNGEKWADDSPYYKEYLAKNTFCLCTPEHETFDSIKFDGFTYVCPKYFNIKQRDIYSLEYKMKMSGNDLSKYIETVKDDTYFCISAETLIEAPIKKNCQLKHNFNSHCIL